MSVDGDLVGRDTVTPPELTRDTPVVDVVEPSTDQTVLVSRIPVPGVDVDIGKNLELSLLDGSYSLGSHAVALDVPKA